MRFRLYVYITGICLMPALGHAFIVTDFPGTFQAATEVTNTVNGWKESVMQTATIQKTIAAVGSAKEGISSMMATIKEYQEKIAEYQEMIAEAQADIQAQVAEVQGAVDTVKNADKIAKGLADRAVNSVKDTATGTFNSVKNTAMSVKDTAMSAKDTAAGVADAAKETAGIGNNGENSSSDDIIANEAAASVTEAAPNVVSAAKASAKNIADTPSARPTRTAISGTVAQASTQAAVARGAATVTAGKSVAAATANTAMKAAAPVALSGEQIAPAMSSKATVEEIAAAPATIKERGELAAVEKSVAASEAMTQKVNKAAAELTTQSLSAQKVEAKSTLKAASPDLNTKAQAEVSVEKAAARAKAADNLKKVDKAGAVKNNLKEISSDLKQKASDVKSSGQELELKQRPVRASFKTSSGYGHIHTSAPLAFAFSSGGIKGGTAMGRIMIVPRDIFIRCRLDYEAAAEKDKFDACLKQINDIRLSEINEENSRDAVDEAIMDMENGYAELLAAGYFEALESYNDSVDFYYKKLHPNVEVENQRAGDTQTGWTLTPDINKLVNERLNELNKIWARQLLVKSFGNYINYSIKTPDEQNAQKRSNNKNLYGKVIVPSVFVKRCGVSGQEPEITEDCLKTLAGDYKNNAEGTGYNNWNEEQGAAFQEYASAYLKRAAEGLALIGEDSNNIADKTNKGPTSSLNITSDVRELGIEPNNVLADEVARKILDAVDFRASAILLKNINQLFADLIPSMDTGS